MHEEYTPLLHGFKGSTLYDNLRADAFDASKEFSKRAAEAEVQALVDKL